MILLECDLSALSQLDSIIIGFRYTLLYLWLCTYKIEHHTMI